jgi:hypothetical protein
MSYMCYYLYYEVVLMAKNLRLKAARAAKDMT